MFLLLIDIQSTTYALICTYIADKFCYSAAEAAEFLVNNAHDSVIIDIYAIALRYHLLNDDAKYQDADEMYWLSLTFSAVTCVSMV